MNTDTFSKQRREFMFPKNMLADRIGGIISIIIGAIAISEAVRLYPARTGPLVGDHTMPGLMGGLMILLGLLFIFVVKGEKFKVEFPNRKVMMSLLLMLGLLFAYWFLIQFLGYAISTLIVSIGLFKVMGSYSFLKSIVIAIVVTSVLYLLFIFWLAMPLPTGILGI
jgi:putative tricarboxylic transport membrane protein